MQEVDTGSKAGKTWSQHYLFQPEHSQCTVLPPVSLDDEVTLKAQNGEPGYTYRIAAGAEWASAPALPPASRTSLREAQTPSRQQPATEPQPSVSPPASPAARAEPGRGAGRQRGHQGRDGAARQPHPGPRRLRILNTHAHTRAHAGQSVRPEESEGAFTALHSFPKGEVPFTRAPPSRQPRGLQEGQLRHASSPPAHTPRHPRAPARSPASPPYGGRCLPGSPQLRRPAAPAPRRRRAVQTCRAPLAAPSQPGTPPPRSAGNSRVPPPPEPRPAAGREQGAEGREEGGGGGEQKFRPLRARPRPRLLPRPPPRCPLPEPGPTASVPAPPRPPPPPPKAAAGPERELPERGGAGAPRFRLLGPFFWAARPCVPRGVRPPPASGCPQRHHPFSWSPVPELPLHSLEPGREHASPGAAGGQPFPRGPRRVGRPEVAGTGGEGPLPLVSAGASGRLGRGTRISNLPRLGALASSLSAWVAAAAAATAPGAARGVRGRAASAGPDSLRRAPPLPALPGRNAEGRRRSSPPPPPRLAPNLYLRSPSPTPEPLRLRLRGSAPSPAPQAPHPGRVNLTPRAQEGKVWE
ncbi:basic proline-rich protein-like [Eumetopias jubatus]|uniref:basic proline-rich protein-like n=1 Tax=Eumetopias jubatus TaxID=34886 RepID=UPI001016F79B|nr:basic proline-rich protein-like [Eumetopias jubatus]